MRYDMKSMGTIITMIIVVTALLYSGYLPHNNYAGRQIEAFNSINKTTTSSSGYIQPQVVDGFTEEPIGGAFVVIPETGKKYMTDENGFTTTIEVPILSDEHFDSIHPKNWGEVTVIVYKEGYREYVLFHTNVWENQNRQGPKILLFQHQEGLSNDPMAIVEGPQRLWIDELVDKYRP